MRAFSIPLPTVLSGFVAVLVGYASSAAIIWQAALAAGATTGQIAGWMTALGLAMGVSTLVLTLWYRAPVLTAWSTPGAALLVTGLHGVSIQDAIGVFIVANALIVLCGVTGLFARLMKIIPHSLASAMLAGILLRFGLQAFNSLNSELILCGSMLVAWLVLKVIAPRYAVIAAMLVGIAIALMKGDIVTNDVNLSPVIPAFITPHFSLAHSISIELQPFFAGSNTGDCPAENQTARAWRRNQRFTFCQGSFHLGIGIAQQLIKNLLTDLGGWFRNRIIRDRVINDVIVFRLIKVGINPTQHRLSGCRFCFLQAGVIF